MVRWGGDAAYDSVKQAYETEQDSPGVKNTLLRALGYAQSKELLQQTLEYSLSSNVRRQDTVSVIVSVANNPMGGELAWDFFKANFDVFNERYGSGGFAASSLVSATASAGVTDAFKEDVTSFFEANPFPAAELEI